MNDRVFSVPAQSPHVIIKADEATAGMISWSLFPVQLPGPSPRDTEANGGVCRCGAGVMGQHSKDCPADGKRLWPVGATWSAESVVVFDGVAVERGCWIVDGVAVWRRDVSGDFASIEPACSDILRAAFCEPEVQS